MVTLKDILELRIDTTRLNITARNPENFRLLQQFIIGPDAWEHMSRAPGLHAAWLNNTLTWANRRINDHNTPTARGPEMGWSVDCAQIAPELLQAELLTLHFFGGPIDGTEVCADVRLQPMHAELVKAFYGKEARKDG